LIIIFCCPNYVTDRCRDGGGGAPTYQPRYLYAGSTDSPSDGCLDCAVLAPRKVKKRLQLKDEREKLITTRDRYRFKIKSAAECDQLCIEKNTVLIHHT
jgi:hypothetical protein